MPETKEQGSEAKPDPGAKVPAAGPDKPYPEQVDSQDKQKDKPDSGQNEDG